MTLEEALAHAAEQAASRLRSGELDLRTIANHLYQSAGLVLAHLDAEKAKEQTESQLQGAA